MIFPLIQYPDPGSNRDGLPHWCLRPARLPIPPSGLIAGAKLEKKWHTAKFFNYELHKMQKNNAYYFYLIIKNRYFLINYFIFAND